MAKKRRKMKAVRRRKASRKTFSAAEKRVSTGIPNFDRLIKGGYEKNSKNLIVGGSGSGKSIFAVQFLVEGMKNNEKCLYITFEEKKESFYSNMLDFGWDLKKYERAGLFTFLEYTPIKVKNMLEEGGGAIENIVLNKKINRIVFDSITSFELLFEGELSKREAAISLFNIINKWNCTSLLTLEEDPFYIFMDTKDSKLTSRAIEFESDSITLLYFIRTKFHREHFLEVLKMRGTDHSTDMYKFEIGRKGISLSKKPVKEA